MSATAAFRIRGLTPDGFGALLGNKVTVSIMALRAGTYGSNPGSQLWSDDWCLHFGQLTGASVGACCVAEDCVETLENSCEGTWHGSGSACSDVTCEAGETINVPGNYSTIQAAVDAASNGDEIIVAPGTYTGTGDEVVDMKGRAITLRASGTAEETIIDGEGQRRVVYCSSGEDADTVIEGFTITGGFGLPWRRGLLQ